LTPSPCRMVMVFTDPRYNNGAGTAPAVITRVRDDGLVNVRVLHDGPPVPPEHRQDWLTSVPLYESRLAAEAAHAERWAGIGHEVPVFAAFWPPRA